MFACLLGSVDCRSSVREFGNHPDGDRVRGLAALLMAADASSGFDMSSPPQMLSRRKMLGATAAAGLGLAALARPASAGYITSLGKMDTPLKDREVDKEVLESKETQDALADLKALKAYTTEIESQWKKDPSFQLTEPIEKQMGRYQIRKTVNKLWPIFDENTQNDIEKCTRVMQADLDFLMRADQGSIYKRESPKGKAEIEKWLKTYNKDLDKILSYFTDENLKKGVANAN